VTTHQTRAPKPNQHERATRQAVIDNLIGRALRGALTIPEAALLADYVRADRLVADKTRRSLGDTTRALQRHREAADAEVQRLEARVEELLAGDSGAPREASAGPREGVGGAVAALEAVSGAGGVRGAAEPAEARSGDPGGVAAA
jgi:hypothetical protein